MGTHILGKLFCSNAIEVKRDTGKTLKNHISIYGNVALLLTATWAVLNNAPVILFLVVSAALYLWLAPKFSQYYAVAAATILPLLIIGLIETWSKHLLFSFTGIIAFTFLITIITLLVRAVYFKKSNVQYIREPKQYLILTAICFPAALTLLLLFAGGNISGSNLNWMLQGDAQNNTNGSFEIIVNNGFPGGLPAIAQGIMAASIAGTIGRNLSDASFVPMMQIQAVTLAVLWAATSVLMGLTAVREFKNTRLVPRLIAAMFGATLPLSWYILGFSIEAGFYNTPVAIMTVIATWIFWRELEEMDPAQINGPISMLLLTSVFGLMAWTPLAIVPFTFFLVALVRAVSRKGFNRKLVLIVSAGFVIVSAFAAATLIPSIAVIGVVAAAEGYMTIVPPAALLVLLALSLLSSLLIGLKLKKPGDPATGLFLLSLSLIAGIAFLFLQSFLATHTIGWGYYPRKMAWITGFCLAVFTTFVSSAFITQSLNIVAAVKNSAMFCIFSILVLGMTSAPFSSKGPLKIFPLINTAVSGRDSTDTLGAISNALGTKEIRLDFDSNDYLVNQWVFQWAKFQNPKPMWSFAYSLVQSPKDVCEAANTWGGDVTLLTKSVQVEKEVKALCPTLISITRNS